MRKRIFIDRKTGTKEKIDIIKRAAENKYDAVVFSLFEKFNANNICIKLAKHYGLNIEAGGHELSLLLPKRLFFFHRDLFRMEQGKRKNGHHFCPTNPKTIFIIKEKAKVLFSRSMQTVTTPRIFHLLADEGHESIWCACPACRAFSPAEQNIIAVNSAADVLAGLDPDARLSFFDYNVEPEEEGVEPRKNMFLLKK
ncbi:MAG: hypothetical protein LBI12_05455 [Treponema sp.]|jgi:hypothetical protein|nr:hypothetical protein [Treponema sp.]